MISNTKDQLLQTASQLFMTKGYTKTSIQNIISEVGIAKGTFYHHFSSKEDLLDALVDQTVSHVILSIQSRLKEFTGNAVEKLNLFFTLQQQWKSEQFELLYSILKVMYSDGNLLYRKKLEEKNFKYYIPIFADIIQQGKDEGLFETPYPLEIGTMIISLSNSLSVGMATIFLNHKEYKNPVAELEKHVEIVYHSMERLLGVSSGTLIRLKLDSLSKFIDFLNRKEG